MVWLLCILTIFITTLIISQQISKPLKSLASESDKLAEKDLTSNLVNLDSFHGDEIGTLEYSFHNVLKNLRSIISVVSESAQQIGSSSEELASISEEVNALSEEIGVNVQQISRGASNQSDLATRAIEDTNQMAEVIDQSLQDIENTLKVIEDVAGQTNILHR
ncbi:MAG: HAMP domain-containing protein [Candidatus Hodarchaeota archaeon]